MMGLLDWILGLLGAVVLAVCVLIGVVVLTLLEREVLEYIQIRKDLNKVRLVGLPQPFSHAIKLFIKEQTYPLMSNFSVVLFSPVFVLFFSLLL